MSRITSFLHNLRLIFSQKITDRISEYERAIGRRLDERFDHLQRHTDQRFEAFEKRSDERTRSTDLRLDERFEVVERRIDERLEAHERRTDKYLLQSRVGIVDRTDVMLQLFEQRLDKQRREIQDLRAALASRDAAAHTGAGSNGSSGFEAQPPPGAPDVPAPTAPNDGQSPADQILSFRRLAEDAGWTVNQKRRSDNPSGPALYDRIIDWKKYAQDGLNNFTPDEQEMVDYILSFIGDPGDIAYAMQHMRRFIGTLQRIPTPQGPTDRLLELGSLMHLAPAIKKFCGYHEVCGADFWESDEKMVHETVGQINGPESHTFELRNFNVERDPFPWPDNHFRVALCCEILEHLQSDPMHMLWELNRTLAPDGVLLLTTPNIVSARSIEGLLVGCAPYLLAQYNRKTPIDQHNREYAPYEVGVALAAAGFTVVNLETEDVWMRSNPAIIELLKEVNLPTENRGDNIFALARKTGAPIERYPKELYVD
jgi:SAM-dependent methyltransferase